MKNFRSKLGILSFFLLKISICTSLLLSFINSRAQQQFTEQIWGNWQKWGDLGNGNYRNPILPGDYSDLDCISVGDTYYAISSTFQYSPGMVILQSKDLVNWTIVSHAINDLTEISPELNWDKMNRYGKGVWAGAIRYHNKKFWIYFGTPDEGYFMTSTKNITGPWAPLTKVLDAKGWDDCCPFWDDDGQAYLIGTNFSDAYKIHLFKLTADGKKIIPNSGRVVYQSKGSEASKLYKINGVYYHFFSEVKAGGRAVMMRRAQNIYGPYSMPKQLSHVQKQFHEPNQGGIVKTKNGDWYFLTHHGSSGDRSGRNMSLLPVNWVNGWPILGEVGPDTIGKMVWEGKKPINTSKIVLPQSSDEFSNGAINPQWEWNYQPRKDKFSLSDRKGWLRLYAFKPIAQNNLLKAGNSITQRVMRTENNVVIVKLELKGLEVGQKAGLMHFGSPNYSAIGIRKNESDISLEFNVNGKFTSGLKINQQDLWLKSEWGLDGLSEYFYSLDGKNFIPFGDAYQLKWGAYRGDRIGIYNFNNIMESGYIDIDYFHYTY